MKTTRKTKQSPKVKVGDPCSDCGVLLAGGFPFKEITREGWRCAECLLVDTDKTRGYSGIDHISEELENIPALEGRKWKAYALKLKEQHDLISYIISLYKVKDKSWEIKEIK